jgi:diaminopimelate decarboxylase
MTDVWRRGFRPDVLDLGGGFNVPSLRELNLWEMASLLGWDKSPRPPKAATNDTLLQDVARVCKERFEALGRRGDLPTPTLYLEPGRALSATTQLLLLRVEALVEREKGPVSALCDGGAMSLSPLLFTEYHTVVIVNKNGCGPRQYYTLRGNMPTPLDLVAVRRELPVLAPGDILAVLDVGAYFTALGNTVAGPRPPIVMLDGDTARLIRRRETYRDLFARDLCLEGEKT